MGKGFVFLGKMRAQEYIQRNIGSIEKSLGNGVGGAVKEGCIVYFYIKQKPNDYRPRIMNREKE